MDVLHSADELRRRRIKLAASLAEKAKRDERAFLEGRLINFYKAAWAVMDPAPYQHNWHLEAIAEHLEAVSYGQIRKLCINLPPRHSKTLLVSVCWNAWSWCQEPDERYPMIGPQARFMCLSYADPLAMDNAVLARRLVESDWYQSRWGFRVSITGDQDAKNKFDTTVGGTRISGSFKGSVTGRGAGIRVYDDPHKMDEVESETIREGVLKVYDSTLKSRFTDPRNSAEVLVAQRGAQNDLSDKFMEEGDVVHLNLPAEYDPNRHCVTVLGTDGDGNEITWEDPRSKEGELLWKDRFGPKELAPFKAKHFEWSAQWQQMPIPRGGGLFKENYWQVQEVQKKIDEKSGQFTGYRFIPDFVPLYVVASLDTAFTEKEENSASALTVWAVYDTPLEQITRRHSAGRSEDERDGRPTPMPGHRRILLVDAWKKHLEMHGEQVVQGPSESRAAFLRRSQQNWGLVEWVAHTCTVRKVNRLLVENKSRGHDVNRELRRLYADRDWGIQLIEPQRDKWARAQSIIDLFTDGMIFAPAEITEQGTVQWLDWADMVIRDAASFRPNGGEDDVVDTISMVMKHLRDGGMAIRKDERRAMETAMMTRNSGPRRAIYEV